MYDLLVKYDGLLDERKEEAIIRSVGIEPQSTGYWLLERQRDLNFEFGEDIAGAERAKAYVVAIPGVTAEIYDDKAKEGDSE